MPRTKKTPSSQSLAARATKGPNRTPKGSGPSVAPSLEERVAAPLVTIDAIYRKLGRVQAKATR